MIDTRKLWLLGLLVFVIGLCVGIRFEKDFLAGECYQTGKFEYQHRIFSCNIAP
jgi:hypothetical protein